MCDISFRLTLPEITSLSFFVKTKLIRATLDHLQISVRDLCIGTLFFFLLFLQFNHQAN
uniref:Uncharacterized protein n=1 Tax=Rhizophora mucronata TaxID=61149 RepID=A0A2P2PX32_RHIMU